jgi:hypothetical protein
MNSNHDWARGSLVPGISLRILPIPILMMLFAACSDEHSNNNAPETSDAGSYTLSAAYDSIRSYPGGGGVFLVSFKPDTAFQGTIRLTLECDPALAPSLSAATVRASDSVVEILLAPSSAIMPGLYPVTVVATHGGFERRLQLAVDILDWQQGGFEDALAHRAQFEEWLIAKDSAYAEIFRLPLRMYGSLNISA